MNKGDVVTNKDKTKKGLIMKIRKGFVNKIMKVMGNAALVLVLTALTVGIGYIAVEQIQFAIEMNRWQAEIAQKQAKIAQRYEMISESVKLCDANDIPTEQDALWSLMSLERMWRSNHLISKSELDFVIVEQNLPLPVADTGYDFVMPKDHVRYQVIKQVFDYVGDLMGREFIIVDDRKEILGGMTPDMANEVPVLELKLAVKEGEYMGYPIAAWADQQEGVIGVEVWWWYDDNMWKEGGYYTILHEVGHLLGLGHADESAGLGSVMGGTLRTANQMRQTKTFGLNDIAALKYLWCNNPFK
jgi:cell division protein FtsB